MNKNTQKRNRQAGFTLTELLVAIAITAILVTIGFVVAPNFIRNLRQSQLDKNAEILYTALQNRMTELRVTGQSGVYLNDGAPADGITLFPEGYEFQNGVSGEDYIPGHMAYFVANSDGHGELTQKLLPPDRVDGSLWKGNWVVEFNFFSGTVYGVFFINDGRAYDPVSFNGLRGTKDDDGKESRIQAGAYAGYFGKGTAEIRQKSGTYKPTVAVFNDEKLTAVFTCPKIEGVSDTEVTFTYKIIELDENGLETDRYYEGYTSSTTDPDNLGQFKATLTLDSLDKTTNRFAQKFPLVTSGADMIIEVLAESESVGDSEAGKSDKFNSLFSDDTNIKNGLAIIKTGRHLQNLDEQSKVMSKITKAQLANDISFAQSSPWYTAYKTLSFTPILNQYLTSFDGNSKTLYELNAIAASKHNGGLFDTFYGSSIHDLTLLSERASVLSTADSGHVGALAGQLTIRGDTKISNIKISVPSTGTFKDPTVTSHEGHAGGLLGYVRLENNSSKASLELSSITIEHLAILATVKNTTVTNSGSAGGIIGATGDSANLTVKLSNITLNKQSDDLKKNGVKQAVSVTSLRQNAGGFIGSSACTLNMVGKDKDNLVSYDVSIASDVGHVGGIVGYLSNKSEITNVHLYGAEIKTSAGNAGGAIGVVTNALNSLSKISEIHFYRSERYPTLSGTVLVASTDRCAGGVFGLISGSPSISKLYLDDAHVSSSAGAAGGIAGRVNSTPVMTDCSVENSSMTSTDGNAGGFAGEIGEVANTVTTISKSSLKNNTIETTAGSAGGLVGAGYSTFTVTTVENIDAKVVSVDKHAGGFTGEIAAGTPVLEDYHFYLSSGSALMPVITQTGTFSKGTSAVSGLLSSGGLVGSLSSGSVTIRRSFASTVIGYNSDAPGYNPARNALSDTSGGLIGKCSGQAIISDSYSDSYTFGRYAGGLFGTTTSTNSSVGTSYAAGYIFGTSEQAGLVLGKISISSPSYTVCCPKGSSNFYCTAKSLADASQKQKVYYVYESFDYLNNRYMFPNDQGTIVQYKWTEDVSKFVAKLGSGFSKTTTTNKYKINTWATTGNSYPYPQITSIKNQSSQPVGNYGDWQLYEYASKPKAQFVYFENYQDYTYGVHNANVGGDYNSIRSEAQLGTNTIRGDGYGILFQRWDTEDSSISLTLQNVSKSGSCTLSGTDTQYASEICMVNNQGMVLCKLPYVYSEGTDFNSGNTAPFLYQGKFVYNNCYAKKGTTENYYFNPRVATCIRTSGSIENSYSIRTPRQLYALSLTYGCYNSTITGKTIKQELDLDYATYAWSDYSAYSGTTSPYFVQNPIGWRPNNGSSTAFNMTYDGNCREIRHLSFSYCGDKSASKNQTQSGMFAVIGSNSVQGAVKNVFLVNEYSSSTSEKLPNCTAAQWVGVLSGQVAKQGTVNNCAVCGYSLDLGIGSGDLNFGGLVGQNDGTISFCSVSVREMKYNSSILKIYDVRIGGFVGLNNGTISYCYTIGGIGHHNLSPGGTSISTRVSGFVGINDDGSTTACYCMTGAGYVFDSDSKPGTWYGFGYGNKDKFSTCYYMTTKKPTLKPREKYGLYGTKYPYEQQFNVVDARGTNCVGLSGLAEKMKGSCAAKYGNSSIYPFPGAVRDRNGNYIHYGGWPYEISSVSMASFSLSSSTAALSLNEAESEIIYVMANDDETGAPVTESVGLMLTTTEGNVAIDNEPLSGDVVDESTGKTVEEMTDPQMGPYPGAMAFMAVGISPGEDTIQIEQCEEQDREVSVQKETTLDEQTVSEEELNTPENGNIGETSEISEENHPEEIKPDFTDSDLADEKIYLMTAPLSISVQVGAPRHIGLVSTQNIEGLTEVISAQDYALPSSETEGEYSKDNALYGEYTVVLPEHLDVGNANLMIYQTGSSGEATLEVTSVTVTRHVLKLTEFFDETYELYDSESGTWQFENYFVDQGEPIDFSDGETSCTYTPITLTGKYDSPVSVLLTAQCGSETYVFAFDLDQVQNRFTVVFTDGEAVLREDTLEYGSVTSAPSQDEINEIQASWDAQKQEAYRFSIQGTTMYKTEEGDSVWTPILMNPVYSDGQYSIQRSVNEYSIRFDSCGGTGVMSTMKVSYDEMAELPACSYKKTGCTFEGWALTPDGEVEFPDGSYVYALTEENGAAVTLYAVWNNPSKENTDNIKDPTPSPEPSTEPEKEDSSKDNEAEPVKEPTTPSPSPEHPIDNPSPSPEQKDQNSEKTESMKEKSGP